MMTLMRKFKKGFLNEWTKPRKRALADANRPLDGSESIGLDEAKPSVSKVPKLNRYDTSQEEAALRLQAMFRGKDARRRLNERKGVSNKRSKMDMLEAEDVLIEVSFGASRFIFQIFTSGLSLTPCPVLPMIFTPITYFYSTDH